MLIVDVDRRVSILPHGKCSGVTQCARPVRFKRRPVESCVLQLRVLHSLEGDFREVMDTVLLLRTSHTVKVSIRYLCECRSQPGM